MFGQVLAKVARHMNDALLWIPDGIDVMITNKNAARLRQILFEKQTHEAATGQNEFFKAIMEAFDKMVTSLGPLSLVSGNALTKLKNCQGQWKRLRCYASTVGAANLVLNKFLGKASRDRAAMVREFKKKLDKSGVQISKSLLTWLSEESSAGN